MAFPAQPAGWMWTSTNHPYYSWGYVFRIDFGVPAMGWVWAEDDEEAMARCVRGTPAPAPQPRFEREEPVPAEPVVRDAFTGLEWQGCLSGLSGANCLCGSKTDLSWQDALGYCESLVWAGHDDWRLPSIVELLTIFDDRRMPPAFPIFFPDSQGLALWSSTTEYHDVQAQDVTAWSLGQTGFVRSFKGSSGTQIPARCVR